jgi:protein-L-isoaspartate(D-aspartate) O-methyltransferase
MITEQIEARGVTSTSVLQAIRTVRRELFVPEEFRAYAYSDHPLPIGSGQTISQPFIVAFMTQLLEPALGQRVLEIGTGSGYQAAILSILVKEVDTIEIVPELGRSAAERLSRLGYANVRVRIGDGYLGWPEKAPFDRIILTAAPPEIPAVLIDQLKPGGRLIAPVGVGMQDLTVVDKAKDGKTTMRSVLPVQFVPMKNAARQE